MMNMLLHAVRGLVVLALVLALTTARATDQEAWDAVQAAQAFRANGEPVGPASDGTYFCEAEEFQAAGAWQAQPWGENYYAATFANCFLSRKAFLGAPEQCADSTATINVDVQQAGRYLVLVRYEAAYRFETQFRVQITQGGTEIFDRLYGARSNIKIWPFGEKLKSEVAWSWGADENIVWEGHDAYVDLQPGTAQLSLVAGAQPAPGAKRNIDLVMLTKDEAQVTNRINTEGYLPLDGWLTQTGDVWLRVTNTGGANVTVSSLSFSGGPFQQHSPYWVHQRNWSPVSFTVPPGTQLAWEDVGGTMDTLNDGQWGFQTTGPCKIELGLRNADGTVDVIRTFDNVNGSLPLTGYADTRYRRQVRTAQEDITDMMTVLNGVSKPGPPPSLTMIAANTYGISELDPLLGLNGYYMAQPKLSDDLRGLSEAQLTAWCEALTPEERANYLFISMGDEIASGIGLKAKTDILRSYLPNAGIGANYSPHAGTTHAFLGDVNKWVTTFRSEALTMPWSEDYIWGIPVGTPQMNSINLDLFRAGIRGKPGFKIMYYVMPHVQGNTPNMWRRMFYSAMGHGATLFNLFEYKPVWIAYTENYVNGTDMYAENLKTLRELSSYEDILQNGHLRPAAAALWFSEVADNNNDYGNSGGAAKRALYIAIRNQQLPLDFVVEADALDGTLNQYQVLYLTDQHVSQAASQKIAQWVQAGGRLFATAGAGMFDETGAANATLRALLGADQTAYETPAASSVGYEKQDLPFVQSADQVTVTGVPGANGTFPVFGAVSRFIAAGDATVLGTFNNDSPAVIMRQAGQGQVIYCGFMPGLSYFQPAIPLRPLDRGDNDGAMSHFMPTEFDSNVGALVGSIAPAEAHTVDTGVPYVEATVIESSKGTIIPLTNWSTAPANGLQVAVNFPVPTDSVSLSSGRTVSVNQAGGQTIFTLDLEVADTLILRSAEGTLTADPQVVVTAEDTAKAITLTGSDPGGLPLTFTVETPPTQGALTGTAPDVTYTPAANYTGPDSFTFTVSNGTETSAPATVSITVTPVNDPPVAVEDSYTTRQDTALTVAAPGVLENDTDAEGSVLTAVKVTDPAHGTLVLNADGSFTYTPEAGWNGADSFTYKANDGAADSDPVTVSLTVLSPTENNPPTADAQSVTTAVDTAKDITLTGSDPDNDPLTFAVATQPAHGTLTGTAPNLTYTPAAAYFGPDSFTFTVNDGQATSAPATVSITVTEGGTVNNPPTADPQEVTTEEDTPVAITLTGSDPDGDPLTFAVETQPTQGMLIGTAPNLLYVPVTDYTGPDSFTFTVNDGKATSAPATVSITVTPVNDPPIAYDDEYLAQEDTLLTVEAPGVLANDTDVDGDPLTAVEVFGPAYGTLALNADGSFTYMPEADYFGPDSFMYRANDGTTVSNVAMVFIYVQAVNDAPVAVDDSYSIIESAPLIISATGVLENDTDKDGDPLTAVKVSNPANGTVTLNADGSFFYLPTPDYYGSDSFTYRASDGQALSNLATVTVTIKATMPVEGLKLWLRADLGVTADANQIVTTWADMSGNDYDVTQGSGLYQPKYLTDAMNGQPALRYFGIPGPFGLKTGTGIDLLGRSTDFTCFVVTNPQAAQVANATIFDWGYAERDGIAFKRFVSGGFSPTWWNGTTWENITPDSQIILPPGQTDIVGMVKNGAGLQYYLGDTLQKTVTLGSANINKGSNILVIGRCLSTTDWDYKGDIAEILFYNRALTSEECQVVLGILKEKYDVSKTPVAVNDAYTTDEDVPLTVAVPGVLGNDTGEMGIPLTAVKVTDPVHGAVRLNSNGSFTYTPAPDYNGSDYFTYQANNGITTSEKATVLITINAVNDAPTAAFDSYTTTRNTPLTIEAPGVLGNDFDAEGDPLTAMKMTDPDHGTVTLNADGSFTFTPETDYIGTASFTYRVYSGGLDSNIAGVFLDVTPDPGNNPPTADPQEVTTPEGTPLSITLTGSDPDGDLLTFAVATQPEHGTLADTAPNLTYTPMAKYIGPDSFTFTVSDGQATSAPATVSITLTSGPQNNPPAADPQAVTSTEGVAKAITLTGSDPDGDPLTFAVATQPEHGTLTGTAPNLTYTSDAGYTGTDSFTFTANDGKATSTPATVSITVTPVAGNNPPTADPQAVSTAEGTAKPVTLTGSDPDGDPLTFEIGMQPEHGTLTGTAPNLTYTPAEVYAGPDDFTFTVSDGKATSAPATVSLTVTVTVNDPPVNNAPVASDGVLDVREDTPADGALQATDPDGDPLTFYTAAEPEYGSVIITDIHAGSFTYTPDADYRGPDHFSFLASDGQLDSNVATVAVFVSMVNDPPAANPQAVTTDEDVLVNITLTGSDPDDDPLSFTVATQPQHGSLAGTAPNLTYTPELNYAGPDGFTFTVSDGRLTSDPATVGITVNPANDSPVALNGEITAPLGMATSCILSATDSEQNPLTFRIVTNGGKGTATVTNPATGACSYTPNPGATGTDTFTFVANDGQADSNLATITVNLIVTNRTPIAVDDRYQTLTRHQLVISKTGLLKNDSDPDGDRLTAVLVSGPLHGRLKLQADGRFTYTPVLGFVGVDTFTYQASDGKASSNIATVSIEVARQTQKRR